MSLVVLLGFNFVLIEFQETFRCLRDSLVLHSLGVPAAKHRNPEPMPTPPPRPESKKTHAKPTKTKFAPPLPFVTWFLLVFLKFSLFSAAGGG